MTETKTRISRWKVALATLAIGAILVVPASADDQTVTFDIQGGDLTELLTETESGGMSGVTYDPANSTESTGQLNASVTDERGTETGWTASVELTDFVSTNDSISADNFELTAFGDINATNGATAGDLTLDTAPISFTGASSAVAIASAADGGGAGTFDWTVDTALNVPAGKLAESYSSTVTLTTADAPTDFTT